MLTQSIGKKMRESELSETVFISSFYCNGIHNILILLAKYRRKYPCMHKQKTKTTKSRVESDTENVDSAH